MKRIEESCAILAITLMSVLPVAEMLLRLAGFGGVPGSGVFVQQLTLWVAFLGAAIAARGNRLLSVSANTWMPERWHPAARAFSAAATAAVTACLFYASLRFVLAQRASGAIAALGIPRWIPQSIMPIGLLLITVYVVINSPRLAAAAGVLVPVLLLIAPHPDHPAYLWIGIPLLIAASLVGLPIFALLGGIALLLFWHDAIPVASVPVATYALVASPILPTLPLFTFAGYLLVAGGASQRLLRVYTSIFGWMPGGLTIATAVACAIFTWAGSGVTIVSMGGLLLPMLVKAGYRERFSIGLINGSGSLGFLFPPSMPVILYGIYSQTAIPTLFTGGLLPGLLMVGLVSAWGVIQGIRCKAERAPFHFAEARTAIWEAKWELAVPVIVLIGLFGGLGTLVEAGAIAVAYTFAVECLVSRAFLARRDYGQLAVECVTVVGGVLLIIGVAVGFTNYLVTADVPKILVTWTHDHIHSKILFLLMLNVVLLIKGSFMDVFSAIIVMVPLIKEIAASFGINPVQLGIIFLANLELGYLTPPVGINLCLSAYRFKQPLATVWRATLPFYAILLAGVLLITYWPWLTTALLSAE
jgi:tripartite ATP-independent transporter DctM subunit